jgi:hypothetical protein
MSELKLWHHEEPIYIAVSKYGFGIHKIPAAAIRLAQAEVPAKAKPSQMLIYQSLTDIKPTGFKDGGPSWPNSAKPKLVGLTSTHRLFVQAQR